MTDCHQPTLTVCIRRLPGHEDLPLPAYQSEFAAGMDLYAAVPADQPVTLKPISWEQGNKGTRDQGGTELKDARGPQSANPSIPRSLDPLVPSTPHIALVPCGFQLAVPPGFEAQIRPRSGLAAKHGISMPNTPGTIDSDYRGQVMVPLINLGSAPFVITRGMRIAQMIIKPVPRVQWQEVSELPATRRGEGGFGHTGTEQK